jgi:hypothetical protein
MAQNRLLQAENELLKKARNGRKEAEEQKIQLAAEEKFLLIRFVIEKYNLK